MLQKHSNISSGNKSVTSVFAYGQQGEQSPVGGNWTTSWACRLEPGSREAGPAGYMASRKSSCSVMVIELERGIQVHVELTYFPGEREDRKFLLTGDVISDAFNWISTPLNSIFLDQAMARLQAAISCLFTHNKVLNFDYIRAELGPFLEIRHKSKEILKLSLEKPTHGLASTKP